jgi:Co/Zn/Cd efflux system component
MAVIAINGAAFLAIAGGAALQGSASLGANALDFLADAATYGISLAVIGRSVAVRSGAAMIKGASLAALALFILGYAIWRATTGAAPEGFIITGLGALGFFANALAALLLVRHREGDANVRSVWLCTRNDLIQSLVVAGTGLAVWVTASRWPDLIAGAILAVVFLQSGWSIIRQSREERKVAA